jgi:hypothetical protein
MISGYPVIGIIVECPINYLAFRKLVSESGAVKSRPGHEFRVIRVYRYPRHNTIMKRK